MGHRHSEHEKIYGNLHVFYISFDLDDNGDYVQIKS